MNDEHGSECAILDVADLDYVASAVCVSAIGVMVALGLAAALWPPPGLLTETHPVVVSSQLAQLRLEPREKGFLALAIVLGGLGGCLALMRRQPLVRFSPLSVAMLIALIPLFAVCCDHALNGPAGLWWGIAGVAGTVALAASTAWITRHV